ncbi:hypothetical protein Memar_0396 [Methanoculleus marisnigri JR1]|uniref:Uncharacterized protein n=1 Tax=Methanoculleus marisnigri (strain ATCC 35101 / DSM 1498 / JR1) TaxID=368407 RepID=A3CSH9_METMJ|nr:hypothetical protein Memar_0396 [Methanoculleus marisnigri JR1]
MWNGESPVLLSPRNALAGFLPGQNLYSSGMYVPSRSHSHRNNRPPVRNPGAGGGRWGLAGRRGVPSAMEKSLCG